MDAIYTTSALSTGDGRNGMTTLADGSLKIDLAIPKEMGGSGEGANPEQLFALGYAACFHSALKLVASQHKVEIPESAVAAEVGIGPTEDGGFGLTVSLEVELPSLDDAKAQELLEAAHAICPYSAATKGNIPVDVALA
ncbi:MAG: organic hydroperoxide resistance protein [Actinomycetota bacterium]|nr:organic hydroperoxide resistance protein [Actinomycetota bacterium]